jgi:two-component system chemotaxis response regulator CheY
MRALVIDDSRTMRRILSRLVEELGFAVVEAEHGADGLAKIEALGAPELALVDWNMPVMNGLDFVRAVRARPDCAAMRVMMVTTETGQDELHTALDAGADEYVMKPFTREVILEKLALMGLGSGA